MDSIPFHFLASVPSVTELDGRLQPGPFMSEEPELLDAEGLEHADDPDAGG